MKKTFKLQTMELAEAAVKDAENFGLTASLEEVDGEISVAYCPADSCAEVKPEGVCLDDVYKIARAVAAEYEYQLKWLREDVGYMRESLYKHMSNGHLPSIGDAGAMKKALKALGLEDSFEVRVPAVYVQY